MQVHRDINALPQIKNPVVTTGTFDGVHLGHQKIIARLKQVAQKEDGETVLLTFFPHPRMVLFPDDNDLKLINTESEKIHLLEKAGIDHLIVIPFTREFSRMSSVEFVRNILVNRIGTKKLVIGYDHHFGRNREGDFDHLKEYSSLYGFDVEEIPAEDVDNVTISSTKIRKSLLEGDIAEANAYLGYDFFLTGKVVPGNKLGRELGYPTANIDVPEKYKLIPANGIYAAIAEVEGKSFKGMMSIGVRPTVGGTPRTIEVNIFNFNQDIYGHEIRVHIKSRLRDEKKFESLEQLKLQMDNDKSKTLEIL